MARFSSWPGIMSEGRRRLRSLMPGHPRLGLMKGKTWMPGTRPGMTNSLRHISRGARRLLAILPANEHETLRGVFHNRMSSVKQGMTPVSAPRRRFQSMLRMMQRHRRDAALVDIPVGNGFPNGPGAVGRTHQHQGFLDADIGPVAVGSAFIETDRASAGFLFRRGGDRSGATQANEYPAKISLHPTHPPEMRAPHYASEDLRRSWRACHGL